MLTTPPCAQRFFLATAAVLLCWTAGCSPARAGKAHEHGVARLNLVQDGAQWSVELQLPLDTLVGFERAPRTAAERQAAQAALARLRDPQALIRLEVGAPAACAVGLVEVDAPVLEGKGPVESGHADARVAIAFQCPESALPQRMDLPMFATFPRLKRVEAQAALQAGQRRYKLSPSNRVIELRR